MSKKLIYNILCSFILLTVVTLSSCDGRHKSHQDLKQMLADKGMLTSFSERINYLPESYSETVTDTILTTGYNVYIKTYTDMDSYVLKSVNKNNINIKTFYRNTLADLSIQTDAKTIFKQTISKSFITELIEADSEYLQPYILKSFWIDDDHISSKDSVLFNIYFSEPEDASKHKSFLLTITKEGQYNITEITTKI